MQTFNHTFVFPPVTSGPRPIGPTVDTGARMGAGAATAVAPATVAVGPAATETANPGTALPDHLTAGVATRAALRATAAAAVVPAGLREDRITTEAALGTTPTGKELCP